MKPKSNGASESDFLEELRGTALDAMVEGLASIHRLKELRREVREDACGEPRCGDEPKRARGRNLGDFLFDFARVELNHVHDVLRFHRNNGDDLFRLWRKYRCWPARWPSSSDCREPCAPEPVCPPQMLLCINASPGRTAGARFEIEDLRQFHDPEIATHGHAFRAADGSTGSVKVWIEPLAARLPPATGREYQLSFEVTPGGFFTPGKRYYGQVDLLVAGRVALILLLDVRVHDAGEKHR